MGRAQTQGKARFFEPFAEAIPSRASHKGRPDRRGTVPQPQGRRSNLLCQTSNVDTHGVGGQGRQAKAARNKLKSFRRQDDLGYSQGYDDNGKDYNNKDDMNNLL